MALNTRPLEDPDLSLVESARQVIRDNYEYGRFHVGAAVRMGDGRVFTGIHVEANVGRVTLCAEAVAIGSALSAGSREIRAIVAVMHPRPHEETKPPVVVTPCGMCREMISDFGPEAWVVIPSADGTPVRVPILDLLPVKYSRPRGNAAGEA